MSDDFKKEARKQYLHYFRFWFIAVGTLFVITVAVGISHYIRNNVPRGNDAAPTERVFDYADVLTDEEEEKLREYIAGKEKEYKADFVVVTFSRAVMGQAAMEQYGYDSTDWEHNMMDIADGFWDDNGFGYNKSWEGDGSILIDNRYPVKGEGGEWLSTSGKVENSLGNWEIEQVLCAVDDYYDSSPYKAYKAYIDTVCRYLDRESGRITIDGTFALGAIVISVIVAAVYAASHLGKNKVRDNVAVNAYVTGGKPIMRRKADDFIRKNVVTRHIETGSGGGGGGGHRSGGGGGGHHTSHSGASHGGGGHRH